MNRHPAAGDTVVIFYGFSSAVLAVLLVIALAHNGQNLERVRQQAGRIATLERELAGAAALLVRTREVLTQSKGMLDAVEGTLVSDTGSSRLQVARPSKPNGRSAEAE